jgi:integrase/recombinase XerD
MRGLKQPPFATPEIKPLSNENIEKLVKAAGLVESRGQYKPKHADRNRLVILFLLDTGLRVGELCRLNVDDVNLETGEVQVIPYRSGLKSRPRTVYIGRRVQKELWRYLLGREPMRENPLFLSNDEKRLTPDSIKHLMNRIGERAQIHLHPHALRHLFAITYLRNGGDVFTLQRLLGHSSLSMVQHYLALAKTDLQSAHRRSSPVDNMRL